MAFNYPRMLGQTIHDSLAKIKKTSRMTIRLYIYISLGAIFGRVEKREKQHMFQSDHAGRFGSSLPQESPPWSGFVAERWLFRALASTFDAVCPWHTGPAGCPQCLAGVIGGRGAATSWTVPCASGWILGLLYW